jgi:acyl transferase domain-containing protein
MVDPIIPDFEKVVKTINFSTPSIPIISTVTGSALGEEAARDPLYWTYHMRKTVRFADAVKTILDGGAENFFLEIGPRATSSVLIRQQFNSRSTSEAVASLSESGEPETDYRQLIKACGFLWLHGIALDKPSFYRSESRLRVALPSYPFERKRYWIEPGSARPLTTKTSGKEPGPLPSPPQEPGQKAGAAPQPGDLTPTIHAMIAEALGCPPSDVASGKTFLQMGMDSLFLTQFAHRIKTAFGVTIGMRQLMREASSISSLAAFIQSEKAKSP